MTDTNGHEYGCGDLPGALVSGRTIVPETGPFCVLTDPQGAAFALLES